MKSLYIILISLIAACVMNDDVCAQVKKTNRPAREPYASMSIADKQQVQRKLVEQLQADSDFIAIEKITKEVLDESVQRRSKGLKPISATQNLNTPESKKRQEDLLDVMIKNLMLMKKYPELGQLDSETRKEVFKRARNKKAV